ncbi:MAG: hypothetical protein ACJ760_12050 [Thermoleophilaceae bacterium]
MAAPTTETVTVTRPTSVVKGTPGGGGLLPSAKTACKPTDATHGGDYEPNDDKQHPFGPLTANQTYGRGAIDTSNDEDWFVFCTTGRQQLTADFTPENDTEEGCYTITAYLDDADGNEVGDGETSPDTNETGHMTYTAPGAGRYFVKVDGGSAGCRYALQVNSDHPFTATVPQS